MKQALVLGLALAANAMTAEQVDNELLVVPHGGKLGDLAKFPTKMGKFMFDEQADDELLAIKEPTGKELWAKYLKEHPEFRPQYRTLVADDDEFMVRLLPRESFQTEEEYQKYLAKWHFQRDDEELFAEPKGKLAEFLKKYPGMIMFDEQADDELMVMPLRREHFQTDQEWKRYLLSRLNQVADDELLIRPIVNADDDEFIAMLLPREHFKTEEEYQKYVAKMRFHRDDEELFVAPEGRLGELAKKYPGKIMFDEADDELLIRPPVAADDDEFIAMLLPREHFKTEEEYQKYVAKMRFHRDDEELFVAPEGRLGDLAKKYPGKIMFDEQADDELMVRLLPRESFQTEEEYQKYLAKWRFQRDDEELFVAPQGKLADLAKKYPGMIMFDEQADDELLAMKKPKEETKWEIHLKNHPELRPHYYPSQYYKAADDNDDELMVVLPRREQFKTEEEYQKYIAKARYHLDDEELFVAPRGDLAGLAKKYPGTIMFDEQADDELIAAYPPRDKFKSEEEYQKFIARVKKTGSRDDADDELIYLGHLIRNAENGKPTAFHTVDDELRAERPSHVKTQEKTQKKKLRPVDETAFLA